MHGTGGGKRGSCVGHGGGRIKKPQGVTAAMSDLPNVPNDLRIHYHDEIPHGARIKVIGVGGGGQ